MSSRRTIRPSWVSVPTQEETVVKVTPAPTTALPTPTRAPAPAPTGTAGIYQQVITSLQNQVNTLLTMYLENPSMCVPPAPVPVPAPAQVVYEYPPQAYYEYPADVYYP